MNTKFWDAICFDTEFSKLESLNYVKNLRKHDEEKHFLSKRQKESLKEDVLYYVVENTNPKTSQLQKVAHEEMKDLFSRAKKAGKSKGTLDFLRDIKASKMKAGYYSAGQLLKIFEISDEVETEEFEVGKIIYDDTEGYGW